MSALGSRQKFRPPEGVCTDGPCQVSPNLLSGLPRESLPWPWLWGTPDGPPGQGAWTVDLSPNPGLLVL